MSRRREVLPEMNKWEDLVVFLPELHPISLELRIPKVNFDHVALWDVAHYHLFRNRFVFDKAAKAVIVHTHLQRYLWRTYP